MKEQTNPNEKKLRNQQDQNKKTTSGNDDDLRNPLTGETRRSEEQIEQDFKDDMEEGGGFEAGGGQPFTG